MNYYTQLQSLVKEYKIKMDNEYSEQFKEKVWPILKREASRGRTFTNLTGTNRVLAEHAHSAGLLEKFSLRYVNDCLVIDWS